jgi:hypothetical protein
MFNAEKFNGFVKDELDDRLLDDIWCYYIFNESDLHSAAYFYMRKYFERKNNTHADSIFVRCEPVMKDKRQPDIVVFESYLPIYMIELKMFKKPEEVFIKEDKVWQDIEKLAKSIDNYPSIKWGFMLVAYDADDMFDVTNYILKRNGFKKISVKTINLRRQESNGRRRIGYDKWRKQFDAYLGRHS